MLKNHIIILIVLFLSIQSYSQVTADVYYVSNDGFLIETQGKKILVDAIFDDSTIYYADVPSDDILYDILFCQKPFDNIDVLLITHKHRDHFSSIPVGKFLLNNIKTKLVCNHQTAELFKSEFDNYDKIVDRVIVVSPQINETDTLNLETIELSVFGMNHSPYNTTDENGEVYNKHAEIDVNGYLVKTGEFSFLHCGDSYLHQHKEIHRNIADANNNLNLLFFFGPHNESIEIVNEVLKPQHIIMMHMPSEAETVKEQYFPIKQIMKNVYLPTEPFEKIEL